MSIHASRISSLALLIVLNLAFSCGLYAAEEAKAELAKAISDVKMFSGLTDAEKADLQAISILHKPKAGEKIIEEGKPIDRMFFVADGQIEVWLKGKCIESMGPQSLVGEFEYLDRKPASAEVRVTKDALIVEVTYDAITALMDKQPRIGYQLMREIAKSEVLRIIAGNTK